MRLASVVMEMNFTHTMVDDGILCVGCNLYKSGVTP